MDEALGPGMPSGVGEDSYLIYRIAKAGYTVVYEPTAWVHHRHRRTDAELERQVRSYYSGHVAHKLTTLVRDGDLRAVWQIGAFSKYVAIQRWRSILHPSRTSTVVARAQVHGAIPWTAELLPLPATLSAVRAAAADTSPASDGGSSGCAVMVGTVLGGRIVQPSCDTGATRALQLRRRPTRGTRVTTVDSAEVTVVMPTHNRAALMMSTLHSVLRQTRRRPEGRDRRRRLVRRDC